MRQTRTSRAKLGEIVANGAVASLNLRTRLRTERANMRANARSERRANERRLRALPYDVLDS
eukprot:8715306-Lingulodinium_polyedra.AAC.1